jgi:Lrp/AsnC family transcriptional regulator, leucine-responsive regulatory protein
VQTLPKIDEIDAKILQMLLLESRTSFTNIAHECGITVAAVRARYKRLWKEGIINGEVILVNPHCLGYRHIVDLAITTTTEDEKEVSAYIESKAYLSELVHKPGENIFFGKAVLRDLNKLSQIIEDLESNQKIKRVESSIWAEAINVEFPQNLIIRPLKLHNGISNSRPAPIEMDQAPVQLDETDKKIAVILSKKSRTPFRKIAEQLGISTKTVIQRYKKLRKNIFTLSTVTLDLSKLGYQALGNYSLKLSNRSKLTEIYSQLLKIPNVIVIIRMFGNYDLYVAIMLEDFEAMFRTNDLLSKIDGIEKRDMGLTPAPMSWPLNLFPSLLEGDRMPKYWTPKWDIQSTC